MSWHKYLLEARAQANRELHAAIKDEVRARFIYERYAIEGADVVFDYPVSWVVPLTDDHARLAGDTLIPLILDIIRADGVRCDLEAGSIVIRIPANLLGLA